MKKFRIIETCAALLILLLGLAAASCTNGYGVLSNIQTERAQVGTTLFKNANVKALGEDSLNYYAVMAKVYCRTFAADSWTALAVNGLSNYYTAGFASDSSSKIWVASMDPAGTSLYGIYSSADGGSTCTAVPSTNIGTSTTNTVDALYWAGDTLFALAHNHTAATYSLYYSDGSAAFAAVTIANSGSEKMPPVLDVVKAGSNYWALTESRVYKGTSPSALTFDATTTTPTGTILTSTTGTVLKGIAVDAGGSALVTRSDGYLFTLTSGASTWTSATVLDSVSLGVLAEVPAVPPATDYRLLVSKHNSTYGYCEWDGSTEVAGNAPSDGAVFSPTASDYTTTVYDKPVTALYYSAANGTILIGLAAQGSDSYALYSNTYSSAWSGWTAE
ncbi:MAG: hypothetical protein NT061_01915 [Spirochaetes bacterium]|nr:hypothetical protein [Spirochaetota bacterium]